MCFFQIEPNVSSDFQIMAFQAFDSDARTVYWKWFHLGLLLRPMKSNTGDFLCEVQQPQVSSVLISVLGYCSPGSGSWSLVVVQSFEMFSSARGKETQGYRRWENDAWSPIADAWLVHCSPKGRQGNKSIRYTFRIHARLAQCSLKGREGNNHISCAFGIQCAGWALLLASSPKPAIGALDSKRQ